MYAQEVAMSVDQSVQDAYPRLRAAVIRLAAVCDGAYSRDGAGFNKPDASLGHRLAALPEWTAAQAYAARQVVIKYERQLAAMGLPLDTLERPERAQYAHWKDLFVTDTQRSVREARAREAEKRKERKRLRMERVGSHFVVHTPWGDDIYADIKAVPGARWDGGAEAWRVPVRIDAIEALLHFCNRYAASEEDRAAMLAMLQTALEEVVDTPPPPPLQMRYEGDGKVSVEFEYSAEKVDALKAEIDPDDRRFDGATRQWRITLNPESIEGLQKLAARFYVPVPDDVLAAMMEVLDEAISTASRAQTNLSISSALQPQGALAVPALRGELRPYQEVAVRYMMHNERVLLGDEMGLGKTLEMLATALSTGALPMLVVCPAALKWNWHAEVTRWTDLRCRVIEGGAMQSFDGDVVVINYELLGKHLDTILKGPFRMLCVDESHRVKNKAAARSKAVKAIASAIRKRSGARVVLATGTPVKNRTVELCNQLDILGVLQKDFGGFWRFVWDYAQPVHNGFGWQFGDGSRRQQEALSRKLREVCMVRRTTRQVYAEMPPVQHVEVGMDIANRAEYDLAESDFETWLQQIDVERKRVYAAGDEGAIGEFRRTTSNTALVKIEKLKQLAIAGKLEQIHDWIDDYLEGADGKLIVFATHILTQQTIARWYPGCARIAADSDKMAEAQRFQSDPSVRVMVCSLQMAEGFTATEADAELFVEFPWTPGDVDQAVARAAYRANDPHPVFAYYAVGHRTIDETMSALLQRKRAVATTVTEGFANAAERIDVGDVIAELRRRRAAMMMTAADEGEGGEGTSEPR